ncbi:MAG: glycosyltransferase family 2 protein, partial [Erysipelotrichia bacterium]|nr:glycosyltransferase family 2 protein [Erysipelotrichia bacterium]
MLFSVILPIYNVEKYLEECVNSILNQDFDRNDYEVILVDDGSKDNSPKICDELAEKNSNIKVIHKVNGGQSQARNYGTNEAKGDYILYIDSDDFIISNDFFKKLADKSKNNPDLIFYKHKKYFDDSKKYEKLNYTYSSVLNLTSYADKIAALVRADSFYGMPWIKAIKRELVFQNNIKFDENLVCEDMDWNYYLITNATSVDFIEQSFLAYRQRPGSVTSLFKLKNLTDFIYIIEKWSAKIQNECKDEKLKHALFGSLAKYYSNLFVVY